MTGERFASIALFAAVAVLAGCSSDLTVDEYPASAAMKDMPGGAGEAPKQAYGAVEWDDSVAEVKERFKGSQPWTGDEYGVYVLDDALDDILRELHRKSAPPPKDGKEEDEDKDLKEAKGLLPDAERKNFIVRQLSFIQGGSRVCVYWLEVNRPDRPSKLVDEIVWSKMALVRTLYSNPPVTLEKVVEKQRAIYGEPRVKEFRSDDAWSWYLKKIDPKVWFVPKKESLWEKSGLTVMLYDWKDPKDPSGEIELIVRNERVFSEFKAKVADRVAKLKAESEAKAKADEANALAH